MLSLKNRPVSQLTSRPKTPTGLSSAQQKEFREICQALIDGPGLFRLDLGAVQRLAKLRSSADELHGRLAQTAGEELADMLRLWLSICRETRLQESALGISLSPVQRKAAVEESRRREDLYMEESEVRIMGEVEALLRDEDA